MEEVFFIVLEVIEDADLIAGSELIISADILSEMAFDMSMLEDVYAEIVESLDVFKSWMMKTFELTKEVVNAMLGLQLMYNMVYTHYQSVEASSRCISVETALQDIEGTLKKNFEKLVSLAQKERTSPQFNTLPTDIQNQISAITNQTPMAYWLSTKPTIMSALKKMPLYHN
ncbi:hypothetical protein ACO2Q8_26120 [Larkinella sp. VNQ87]|uniref:hypothetical protein n=1 Tax=Larkinella sp. VNQ87 TaxID=3400921 RepID=UPI003C01B480